MIRADALAERLARAGREGALPPLVWIAGDEPLPVLEASDAVRAAARALGFDERRVFHVERGFRLDELAAEAGTGSLFASRRLIELRMAGKPTKELGEGLAALLATLGDDTRLLAVGPRLDRKTTEAGWFERLDRAGWYVPVPPVDRARLPTWIGERLARQRQRADADTLRMIAERVEGNLLAADQEVRKLGLLFPEGALPADAVRAAVLDVARWDPVDLVVAALSGDAARAARCLGGLRDEGVVVPQLLGFVADAIRALLKAHAAAARGQPVDAALDAARMWGERKPAARSAMRRLGPPELVRLLRACARIDRMAKGLVRGASSTEPWQHHAWHELEAVVLRLAGVPVPTADEPAAA